MAKFPAGSRKRVGGWQNATSLPVYSFWTWCSTGRICLSFIFIFPFIKPGHWVSRADQWACAPGEQRTKWEIKIVKERPHTRSHWCVLCGLHSSKNDYAQLLRCEWLIETPWTVALQAPLSLGFPRQEYWSGLPFSSPSIEDVLGQWKFSVWT